MLLTILDVIERTRTSRGTVESWIESGQLEAFDVSRSGSSRKRYRVEEAALERFVGSRAAGAYRVLAPDESAIDYLN